MINKRQVKRLTLWRGFNELGNGSDWEKSDGNKLGAASERGKAYFQQKNLCEKKFKRTGPSGGGAAINGANACSKRN